MEKSPKRRTVSHTGGASRAKTFFSRDAIVMENRPAKLYAASG
jgi:hypothetical protein